MIDIVPRYSQLHFALLCKQQIPALNRSLRSLLFPSFRGYVRAAPATYVVILLPATLILSRWCKLRCVMPQLMQSVVLLTQDNKNDVASYETERRSTKARLFVFMRLRIVKLHFSFRFRTSFLITSHFFAAVRRRFCNDFLSFSFCFLFSLSVCSSVLVISVWIFVQQPLRLLSVCCCVVCIAQLRSYRRFGGTSFLHLQGQGSVVSFTWTLLCAVSLVTSL